MKVLISCGGTGGHINPGLAIADIIKSKYPDTEFLFAGTPKGMEAKLVPQAGYRMEAIKVAGFQRKISLEKLHYQGSTTITEKRQTDTRIRNQIAYNCKIQNSLNTYLSCNSDSKQHSESVFTANCY